MAVINDVGDLYQKNAYRYGSIVQFHHGLFKTVRASCTWRKKKNIGYQMEMTKARFLRVIAIHIMTQH
jgi:hypothetical protein